MQRRKLNCATIEVTNNRDMNGRATADEINCGLRTGKGRRRLRKACLTHLGSLTVAGLFVALAPMPTMAGEDERGEHKEIEALEAKVASLPGNCFYAAGPGHLAADAVGGGPI
jgi:hypothetical protein